jgi:hypothetical protein
VNWPAALVELVPTAVVTVTSTLLLPAGEVARQELAEQETWLAEDVPKATEPPLRLEPLTVTTVPPVVGPVAGLIAVTTGAGGGGVDEGVYTSAVAEAGTFPDELAPPATRTLPSGSRVAVWP